MTPEECAALLDRGWEMNGAHALAVYADAAAHLRRLAALDAEQARNDGVTNFCLSWERLARENAALKATMREMTRTRYGGEWDEEKWREAFHEALEGGDN